MTMSLAEIRTFAINMATAMRPHGALAHEVIAAAAEIEAYVRNGAPVQTKAPKLALELARATASTPIVVVRRKR